jgi:hypothetical protein
VDHLIVQKRNLYLHCVKNNTSRVKNNTSGVKNNTPIYIVDTITRHIKLGPGKFRDDLEKLQTELLLLPNGFCKKLQIDSISQVKTLIQSKLFIPDDARV